MTKYKQKLTETKNILNEYTDHLKRLQAEFENFKKRAEKEHLHVIKNSNEALICQILPILDDLEQTLKSTKDEQTKQGIELIHKKLLQTLGIRTIQTKDQKFDPYKHECLLKEHSDLDEDTIIEEIQRGFILNDKIIRCSKVKLSKGVKQNE